MTIDVPAALAERVTALLRQHAYRLRAVLATTGLPAPDPLWTVLPLAGGGFVLLAVTALLAYSAAFDLDHWAEWIVFGGIVATVIGAMIAVHSR